MKLSRKFVSDYIDIKDDINTVAEKIFSNDKIEVE